MVSRWFVSVLVCLIMTASVSAQLQVGDAVYGLSQSDPVNTIELVRGPVTANSGVMVPDFWDGTPFAQGMEFDNYNGISHNANGNLLATNFGTSAVGGTILSFSTTNSSVNAGQLIGDTGPAGIGGAVTISRLGGLSVNPSNNRIAVAGYDSAAVYVFDYTPGDTMGSGAALANGRETMTPPLLPGATQGTAWLDDNTVLAFGVDGALYEVDAVSMSATAATFVNTAFSGSQFTDLEYNPTVSPYVYASYSSNSPAPVGTINTLFILDPNNGYSLVKQLDLSTSANTLREIALGPNGELFLSQYGGSQAPGAVIDVLPDVVNNPGSLMDNSSFDWYMSTVQSSFNGIDVALGGAPPTPSPDFNMDGSLNCLDVNALTTDIAAGTNTPLYDLNQDGDVNQLDLNDWLSQAGEVNLGPGKAYLPGDADLSGGVDGSDFGAWNSNKFQSLAEWCSGDFNADGSIDGSDFGIWNTNKFQSSDGSSLVPEPAIAAWILVLGFALGRRR